MIIFDYWKIYKLYHKLGGPAPIIDQFMDTAVLEKVEHAESLADPSSISVSVEDFQSYVFFITTAAASIVNSHHTKVLLSPPKTNRMHLFY